MTPTEASDSMTDTASEVDAVPLDSLDFHTFVELACERGAHDA